MFENPLVSVCFSSLISLFCVAWEARFVDTAHEEIARGEVRVFVGLEPKQ